MALRCKFSRRICIIAVVGICCIPAYINFVLTTKSGTLCQKLCHCDEVNRAQDKEKNYDQRRKGVIIVAHGKSGSSFTLSIFDKNELVFAVYEPLNLALLWMKRDKIGKFNQTEAVLDLITAFMTCTFSKNKHAVRFLEEYSGEWNRRRASTVLMSPPFCTRVHVKETCVKLEPKLVEEECLKKDYSVIKVMYNRLPGRNIEVFEAAVQVLKNKMDVRVVHLVRDPRGVINSRINLGWIKDYPSDTFSPKVREVCDLVLNNVLVGDNFSEEMKRHYMLLRYENISHDVIETAKTLYRFAEMRTTESLFTWLQVNVRPKRAEKWVNEASSERTAVVEKTCRPLFTWLRIQPAAIPPTF